jgi:hypothetical protein
MFARQYPALQMLAPRPEKLRGHQPPTAPLFCTQILKRNYLKRIIIYF